MGHISAIFRSVKCFSSEYRKIVFLWILWIWAEKGPHMKSHEENRLRERMPSFFLSSVGSLENPAFRRNNIPSFLRHHFWPLAYQVVPGPCRVEVSKHLKPTNYIKSQLPIGSFENQKQWSVEVAMCINEWANGGWDANEMTWRSDWINRWTNEPINQRISECMNTESMNQWTNGPMNQYESMNQRTIESMNQWMRN